MANVGGGNRRSHEIVEANSVLVASIRSKLQTMPSEQPYIYEVPKSLRGIKEEDEYLPQIVSIGPIHREKNGLQDFEDQKKWYLNSLLSRTSSTPTTCLEESVKGIREMEEDIRKCYKRPINLTSDVFVEMMILDGYFILELLYNFKEERLRNTYDPIFNTLWMQPVLRKDLMLLENQIPSIVLNRLFDISRDPEQGVHSLNHLVIYFFSPILPTFKPWPIPPNPNIKGKHLLELLRNYLISKSQPLEIRGESPPLWEFTFNGTDLLEAGVKLKRDDKHGLLDIKFNKKNGVLEIPRFFFGDVTVHLFRNLIALEQCDRSLAPNITSYTQFLNILINSRKDVRLLHHKKILECYGKYDKVANSINKLCKDIRPVTFHYHELCGQINEYYRRDYHKWRATLKHDYFNTPWAVISFLGAIVLLILTFLQTLVSFRS